MTAIGISRLLLVILMLMVGFAASQQYVIKKYDVLTEVMDKRHNKLFLECTGMEFKRVK